MSDQRPIPRELSKFNIRKTNRKWAKEMKKHFTKEKKWMTNI